MDKIPDNTSTKAFRYIGDDTKHLKASYWLACHQRQDAIILRLTGMGSNNPAAIEWKIPIEIGYKSILVNVLDNGALEVEGSPNGVIYP